MEFPDELKAHQRVERGSNERWVLGRWSHHMSFNKSSSKKGKMERPLGGVARKSREKDLG
jgi:hypothetical protein